MKKKSRLTTDTMWAKWGDDFNQFMDLQPANWGELQYLHASVATEDHRQCRHFPESVRFRLQYPGVISSNDAGHRIAGRSSRKSIRTDEERREQNTRWAAKYNALVGIGELIEMHGRSRSLPPLGGNNLSQRTGMIEERDGRKSPEGQRNGAMEQAGIPTFYPPPKTCVIGELHHNAPINNQNVIHRSTLERPVLPTRRNSVIEMNFENTESYQSDIVDVRVILPETDPSAYECNVRRLGEGTSKYPIRDAEWMFDITIHEATKWYSPYVRSLKDYFRADLEEVVRLGNQMVVVAGGYRQAARELQEINLRRRSHAIDRIESTQHLFSPIAPHLVDIARRGHTRISRCAACWKPDYALPVCTICHR